MVVGAGPAGVAAAIAAKRTRAELRVVLLGDEDWDPYEKPPLSKAVLLGTEEPGAKPIVSGSTLKATGVEFVRGTAALSIDRSRRVLHLVGRSPVSYDALILATGAKTRTLPILPPTMPNVHYLRSASDALGLRGALRRSAAAGSILVVGAGLIGLEAAAAIAGPTTLVIEAGTTAMARVCSPEFARLIIERHAAAGVRFRFGTTITAASPAHDGIYLQLRDGEVIEAATVIVGVGATPAIALAVDAGLPTADGILVDDHCRSTDPAIYAAGDVAEFSTRWCPQPTRLENWRHALDQGQIAGTNAAGGDEIYDAVPSFWSDQYDLMIQGAGWPDGLASRAVRRVLGADCLLEFHLRDGKVRYATGLGAARDINIARRLIARQITVAARKLADPTITLQTLLKV